MGMAASACARQKECCRDGRCVRRRRRRRRRPWSWRRDGGRAQPARGTRLRRCSSRRRCSGRGSSVQRFRAPQAWLWRSMAGVRAASWSWSRGEARVAAAAELLWNIAPMNPLPHLTSASGLCRLGSPVPFCSLDVCTGSLLREGFSMPLFGRKDMEKRIFRVSQAHKLKVHQVQGKKSPL